MNYLILRTTYLMNRIKEILLEKHIKQIELSTSLGLAKSTVSQWVSGKAQPSLPMLFRIAKELDCEVTELIEKDYSKQNA